MDQMHERREFTRVPFATETIIRGGEKLFVSGNSVDVSMNGLQIAAPEHPYQEEEICEVELRLTGAEPAVVIRGRGTIARSSPGILVVHFVELDLDSYQHLQQLILNNTEHPEQAEREFRSHAGIRKPLS